MKTKMITILLAAMLAMTGCELRNAVPDDPVETLNTQKTEAAAENTENENTENSGNTEEPTEPAVDYTAYYQPVIDDMFKAAMGEYDAGNVPEGGVGLMEGYGDMLWDAGFAVTDLSGDGIPELLIGSLGSGMIFAVFTVSGGAPKLVLEGWYRNAYYLLQDGTIYNRGSGGAAYTILGIYDISEDGSSLVCRDCWFTHEKDGDFGNLVCWYNTAGVNDITVSEELTMTLDELWEKEEELAKQRKVLDLTTFAEYGGVEKPEYAENPTVSAVYGNDYTGECDSFAADDADYAVDVVFTTDAAVRNFKVIALTLNEITDDGYMSFSFKDLYIHGDLTPDKGLAVKMSLPETIPFYGISYTDGTGADRVFSVNLSGFDGSVYLAEIGGVG